MSWQSIFHMRYHSENSATMEEKEISSCNSNIGFTKLVCEDDLNEEHLPHLHSNHTERKVYLSSMTPRRVIAVSLAALAALLLIVDISLGVHYNKLTDTHFTTEDIDLIGSEINSLQDIYKTAINTMKGSQKQLDSERKSQTETKWELEHQTKRQADHEAQIEKITQNIAFMKSHLPMINNGCKHCAPGWLLMNSACYYFSFSSNGKTWEKARQFCQLQGGDLLVIDSKDKENATVNVLINNQDPSKEINGYWIGLRDTDEEGTWKWLDGTDLIEAYWNDGEPNDIGNEDCAAVYPLTNFFKAWNDAQCSSIMKWICEKAPTAMS